MRVVFRTDASQLIGSGHVVRCLSLADELRARGEEVLFVCRELAGNLNRLIEEKGYDLCRLPAPDGNDSVLNWNKHATWLGVDWQQDAKETQSFLQSVVDKIDWLVVDHYALDKAWETTFRSMVGKIMVIDDLADRQHDCDLILDQNFYLEPESRYENLVPVKSARLLGQHYALLRPEFHELRNQIRSRDGVVKNILVFFGGVDATNETAKTLRAIATLGRDDLTVNVVVGSGNLHQQEVRGLCEELNNVSFHCQVSNMAELIANADLAVGAGGSVTWERLCLGLPALVMSIADNQTAIAEDCGRSGLHVYLGQASDVSQTVLAAALQTALQSPALLMSLSMQAMRAVDGKGLARVVQQLSPLEIDLRMAVQSDCQNIYRWRNAEETRRHIFDKDEIPFEVHQEWFRNSLERRDRVILIGESNNKPVGVLRYDLKGDEAMISVYLVPGKQPSGCGSQLIWTGSRWLQENRSEVKKVYAEILDGNIASVKAFEKAGYQLNHLTYCDEFSDDEK